MYRTQFVLDMHPYDASDLICDMLAIARKETEDAHRPTLLIYAWAPSIDQLDAEQFILTLDELTQEGHWHVGKRETGKPGNDFLWGAYWPLETNLPALTLIEEYRDVVQVAQYVWDSLAIRSNIDESARVRAAIGKSPYSAMCGLRLSQDGALNIDHCEQGSHEPVVK